MSFRDRAPLSTDPQGIVAALDDLFERVDALETLVARAALPAPLRFVAVPVGGGSFTLSIVNDDTGNAVVLGVL